MTFYASIFQLAAHLLIEADGLVNASRVGIGNTIPCDFAGYIEIAKKEGNRACYSDHMQWVSKIDLVRAEDAAEEKNGSHEGSFVVLLVKSFMIRHLYLFRPSSHLSLS